jgi:flagellar M-ring protein FliF
LAASARSILKRAGEFFQNLEKKKLIRLIVLAAVIVAAGIIGAVLLNQVKYTVLFSGLDPEEAGTIKTVLDEKGVPVKVQGTSTIIVPEKQADELRIELASEGYPSTGLNYELFTNAASLGSTDLERRTYLQYQLQENIRKALRTMEKVQDSIVMVNLMSDSSFVLSENQSEASAAVTLKLKNGQTLSNSEARAIGQFVMKCVPELKPENVSIVDSTMKYYDITGEDGEYDAEYSSSQLQLTELLKETLTEQVLRVLDPAFGKGNVAVSVNLHLNLDQETVSKVEFKPPIEGEAEGLVRSFEEIYKTVGRADVANGAVGTDPNGIGTPAYVAGDLPEGVDISSTRTYNYELNEIQTQIKKAGYVTEGLSVAVLVNSSIEGVTESLDKVKNLVAQSIGVKPDYISIETMPFADTSNLADAFNESRKAADRENLRKMIVTIIEVVVIAAAVVLIVKLFLSKQKRQAVQPLAVGAGGETVGLTVGEDGEPGAEEYDLSDLVLRKSSEAEKIEELMDRYPETVAQILRTWIAEDN